MSSMIVEKVQNFFHDQDGATAIEYAILAGVISIVIVAGATAIGGAVQVPFTTVSTVLGS